MNAPKTINVEKYTEALNNLIGIDSAYLGDSDKDVNAIIEVIVEAKKLENKVKELTEENEKLKAEIKDIEEDYDCVYEQAEADIRGNIADGGTSCHWCMDGHRRDIVRKMQERLKSGWCADSERCCEFIDHVANEMLEENK